MAIGAPNYREKPGFENAGAVFIYDLNFGQNFNFYSYKAVIYSFERKARFGKRLVWIDNTLLVSAPSYSGSNLKTAFSNE